MNLDPAVIEALRILGGAAAGAVAGGLVAEWRAGKAEDRVQAREAAAEERADERDARRLRRDQALDEIAEVGRDYVSEMDWLRYRASGDAEAMAAATPGHEHYSGAVLFLVADEDIIREILDLQSMLWDIEPGAGLGWEVVLRIEALRGTVTARLGGQRERIIRGEKARRPSRAFVRALVQETSDKYGIPPHFRPTLVDDEAP